MEHRQNEEDLILPSDVPKFGINLADVSSAWPIGDF